MIDAPQGPQAKPGILDIAPYVGGKSAIAGRPSCATPWRTSMGWSPSG